MNLLFLFFRLYNRYNSCPTQPGCSTAADIYPTQPGRSTAVDSHPTQPGRTIVADCYATEPELIGGNPTVANISGITFLGDELFVVCSGCKSIQVFDLDTLTRQSSVPLYQLKEPYDMTSAVESNSLYICDTIVNCVFAVELTRRKLRLSKDINKWKLKCKPYGISKTTKPSIIVSFDLPSKPS